MDSSSSELEDLTNRLVDRTGAYGMEASTEKGKTMTNSTNNFSADISMNSQKLKVIDFKHLGTTLCKVGTCWVEIRTRIASAMAAVTRLIKQDLAVQHHQLRKQVQVVQLSCHLHPPLQLWNMDPAGWLDSEKRIRAFGTKCLKKLPCISYSEHKTNNWLRNMIKFLVGPQEPLLATLKRGKLAWLKRVTHHNSLSKTILQGTFEGWQCCGR